MDIIKNIEMTIDEAATMYASGDKTTKKILLKFFDKAELELCNYKDGDYVKIDLGPNKMPLIGIINKSKTHNNYICLYICIRYANEYPTCLSTCDETFHYSHISNIRKLTNDEILEFRANVILFGYQWSESDKKLVKYKFYPVHNTIFYYPEFNKELFKYEVHEGIFDESNKYHVNMRKNNMCCINKLTTEKLAHSLTKSFINTIDNENEY